MAQMTFLGLTPSGAGQVVTAQFTPQPHNHAAKETVLHQSRECPILCVRGVGLQVVRESVGVSHG